MTYLSLFLSALPCLLYLSLHVSGTGSFPRPLSAREEQECLEKIRHGDLSARNRLVEHNLRLVAHIMKKYYAVSNEQDDLISIGAIGLIKAAETFDGSKGARFATYASRCIENEILMTFRSKRKSAGDISICDPIGTDREGNSLTLMDLVAEEKDILESIDFQLQAKRLYQYMEQCLSERERQIMLMRYGLQGYLPMTQKEVARKLRISRSYVSRIEKKAIEKLRAQFGAVP